jgi:hypothetical protein
VSKHTPGPWEIESIDSAPDDHLRIMGRPVWPCTRFGVKGVWDIASVNELGDENVDEQIANARLIAAAPDMLEALREARTTLSILRTQIMVEIGRCADPSESRWEGVPEKLKERTAAVDAAIAAATGEV